MKYEEYGCFDIDEQQKIDNEVYENKFKIMLIFINKYEVFAHNG